MPLSEIVLIIMGLLTVAMVAAGGCRNLPIPFTVILVIIGMGLGEMSRSWAPFAPLTEFRLSPDLVFFIFLPALIFESGFNLDARQLIKDLAPVLILAIPALLISTAVTGFGVSVLVGVSLPVALVFGALISATDPVAVVALFKELGAPLRMTVLVEGESLLNDATAIVLFGILLTFALADGGGGAGEFTGATVGLAVVDFLKVFVGGAIVGVVIGILISELLYRLDSTLSAVLTMSIVMAYVSFIVAEHVLHVSGVMAAAAAAVSLGVYGVTRLSQEATKAVGETWEFIALVSNSLLFLLVGLSVEPVNLVFNAGPIAIAIALVLAARAATLYSMVPATTRVFSLPRITLAERHIMWWGGLKGGLAIAIVLSIPEALPGRQLLLDMTLGVVLFTLLVNAPTIRPLMRRMGLDQLTNDERLEINQSLVAGRKRAGALLQRIQSAALLSRPSQHRIDKTLGEALAVDDAGGGRALAAREAYLAALSTEVDELNQLYELGVINQYTFFDFRNILQRDREAHGDAEQAVVPVVMSRPNVFLRVETALLRRLREHDWAAGFLSRYQNMRLTQHLQHNIAGILMCEAVLETLESREGLDPTHREALVALYQDRLERRRGRVELVRREFPEFYKGFETRLFTSVALNCARLTAEHEHHRGEIGSKAYARIDHRVHAALEELPPISTVLPTLSARELMALIPLFSDLSEPVLEAVAGHAHPVTFLPRDIVIGEGERGDALYIITHGSVSVYRSDAGGENQRVGGLGEGDFFGETALLGDPIRTATVKADTPSTLLRLTRRDILRLAESHPEVGERLEAARETRAS